MTFQAGAMGIRLQDTEVNGYLAVVVLAFPKNVDGSVGQAAASHDVDKGDEVVSIEGKSCEGKSYVEVIEVCHNHPASSSHSYPAAAAAAAAAATTTPTTTTRR